MDAIFLNEKNINTLYEILLQELKINENSNWILQIKQIFRNNINFFLANVNLNNSLLELNKLFLKQTIIAINKLIPNLRNENKKINILPEEINFPHKIEDIKNIKKDLFDEEFNLKKQEFDNVMKKEKPNIINFSDDYKNEKITDMEQLISNKINERERDIPKIQNLSEINNVLENVKENNNNNNNNNNKNNDKNKNKNINLEPINLEPINLEPIKIEFEEISDEKNINEKNINEEKKEILNKKKKVNFNFLENDEIIPEIKTTIYEEQKSIELSKIQNDSILNEKNIKKNISNVTNFLPMNEFVKKINEIDMLNKKIDNLTNLVEMLINEIQEQKQKQKNEIICENGSYI